MDMMILIPVGIVTGLGVLAGVVLTLAARFMAVPVDERFEPVRAELPGANCGACGFAGCDEYAQQLIDDDTLKTNLCTPGGESTAKKLSEVLGKGFEDVVAKHAIVHCAGTRSNTEYIMDYQGPQTCEGNNYFFQGRGSCSHSCLGYGDCVAVCPYDAIYLENGIAVVDYDLCTGCGLCAKNCPNKLIEIVPANAKVYVACSSTDRGAFVRKVCAAGCIGCKKCERTCEYGAVTINDNLASIDPEKCTNCGACVGVCPTKVIRTTQPLIKEEAV